MIMAVAGSGATHAAAYICNRFPQQSRGGTICLSKHPCTFCLKLMIQCGVSRIIVQEHHITSIYPQDLAAGKWYQGAENEIIVRCVNYYGVRVEGAKAGIEVGVSTVDDNVELLVNCIPNRDQVTAKFTPTRAGKHRVIVRQEHKIILLQEIDVRGDPEESQGLTPSSQPASQQGRKVPDASEESESLPSSQVNPDGKLKSEKDQLAKLWEPEPSKKGTPKPTMPERWNLMLRLLLPSNTAYSALDLTNEASTLVGDLLKHYSSFIHMDSEPDEDNKKSKLIVRRPTEMPLHECVHMWLLGLCIITSMRSEDKQAKVGAVLAKVRPKALALATAETDELKDLKQFSIDVFCLGYNGSRKGALHRDFLFQGDDDKGKWVLHAEQNVFMFRCTDDTSKCTLYSTHSPCLQCSGIIREKHVQKVYFLKAYRAPPDLDEGDLCHHISNKDGSPFKTLTRAIKEIKRDYPEIKKRLGTGGPNQAADQEKQGKEATRKTLEMKEKAEEEIVDKKAEGKAKGKAKEKAKGESGRKRKVKATKEEKKEKAAKKKSGERPRKAKKSRTANDDSDYEEGQN